MVSANDLMGQKFGRLTVIGRGISTAQGKARWLCRCECGEQIETRAETLRLGKTRSCGCLKAETRLGRLKHGGTRGGRKTKEWRCWIAMRRRCIQGTCPNSPMYEALGMDPEWAQNFQAFLDHIGPAPTDDKHVSVDRIDNAKGYFPGNVRWASKVQQARNTRRNIMIVYEGRRMTFAEACQRAGVNYYVAYNRRKRGKPVFG